MTREARMMSGIILITVPIIQYGGYFLVTSLMAKGSGYMDNPLRQNFFRAGHAHAGVIVILSLVCQMLADAAALPRPLLWAVRIGVPLAAIFISSGFFSSMLPPTATEACGAVSLIYAGAVILALAVVTLGVGLLRSRRQADSGLAFFFYLGTRGSCCSSPITLWLWYPPPPRSNGIIGLGGNPCHGL